MNYSLGNTLSRGMIGGLDPSAKAYINAVVAAGATVSGAQREAINTFVKTGKTAGWYSQLKRMYLPIWAIASPNAIDIIEASSGSFVGGVTHASGYVQGDGSTGYFSLEASLGTLALTASSGYMFSLVTQASTLGFRGLIGRTSGTTTVATLLSNNASQLFRYNNATTGAVTGVSAGTGIISVSREGGVRAIYRRITASRSVLISTAGADAGSPATGGNVFALAINGNAGTGDTLTDANNARSGAFGIGLGMTNAQDSAFTSSLKTLWETCTGLTLP
jgi:hypothetical protein